MSYPINSNQKEILLCIDSAERNVLKGRFYCPTQNMEYPFDCLSHFLIEMQQILDVSGAPRAFNEMRTFSPFPESDDAFAENETESAPLTPRMGSKATFSLRILFRQNASWQGLLSWLEGKQEQSFRSALELIILIYSAVQQENPQE